MRVCIDCKHYKSQQAQPYLGPITVSTQPECDHPEAATRDLVHGRARCYDERNSTKGCGKTGKLWTPKQP